MENARHYGMDWLRIGAFGLLIFYHIGMYFVPWDWHVKIAEPIGWVMIPMLATNAWRIALLFAVSGYASHKLIARLNGPGAFLGSRTARLLIPLAFGIAVIVPVQPWIELMAKHGYSASFWHFWTHDYFRFGALNGIILPTWNHLWFVAYLWVYSMVIGIALWLPQRVRHAIARAFERVLAGLLILIVPMLLLALQEFVLFPDTDETHALLDDWAAHIVYFPIFLFGWLLARSEPLWAAIRAHWKVAGLLALAGYAFVVVAVFAWPVDGKAPKALSLAFEVARIIQGWGAIVALIGLADRFLNHDHPMRKTLTESVFPFYIIHQTIIMVLGWWLLSAGLSPEMQFLSLVATTIFGCWLFYRIGREVPGFRLLIGLKGFRPPRAPRSRVDRTAEGLG